MAESIIDYMRTSAPAALPIFRSEQQMRLLGVLFARRGVELSVSDLAAQAGVAIATASREVERLEAHGILVYGLLRAGAALRRLEPWATFCALPLEVLEASAEVCPPAGRQRGGVQATGTVLSTVSPETKPPPKLGY